MSATNQGLVVEWNTVAIGTQISEATLDDAATMVDCTALGDSFTDNRAGTGNPTASITVLLKVTAPTDIDVGDVGELSVDGLARDVIIQGASYGGPVNAPRTIRLSFASTLDSGT